MKSKTFKHITRWSWGYYLLSMYINLLQLLFYRKIVVEGKKYIPKNEPVIFAPNHQNALMDPLAIVYASGKQIVFLARADIFKIPLLPAIFRWLKILPVYRLRDGSKNLKNNEDTFNAAIKILENKKQLGLFPEAAHNNKRQLLAYKKGVPRIAFQAEEQNDFKLGVKIVPVGIYYSRYNKFRSIIHVRFGKPINVADYIPKYRENTNQGMFQLRDAIKTATEPLVINITNLEFYDMYESLRTLYFKNMAKQLQFKKLNQKNKFIADKMTIHWLDRYANNNPEKFLQLRSMVHLLSKYFHKYNLSYQSISKPKLNIFRLTWNFFLLIVFFPLFLYGFINNFIPYILPKLIVLKIKDMQFHSSVKFVWGLFAIPLFYIIQSAIFWSVTNNLKWSLLYLLSLPVTGMLAQVYHEWFALTRKDALLFKLKKTNRKVYRKIKNLHASIMSYLDEILQTNNQ